MSSLKHLAGKSLRLLRRAAVTLAATCAVFGCGQASVPSPLRAHASGLAAPTAQSGTPNTIGLFPLEGHSQDVDHWIDPASAGYDAPFMSSPEQKNQFKVLVGRMFGAGSAAASVWNREYVDDAIYKKGAADMALEIRIAAESFDNSSKTSREIGYGPNFRPHPRAWIDAIAKNMDADQFARGRAVGYDPANRAIATGRALLRGLPTLDPLFLDARIAGAGYPFDLLQVTAVRPGAPVYVIGRSLDHAWFYVETPDARGWVDASQIAMVSDRFVAAWTVAAAKGVAAIVQPEAAIEDVNGSFRFNASTGDLFPLAAPPASGPDVLRMLVPARGVDGSAEIREAKLASGQAVRAPWSPTPRHLATLLKANIGRPYGWGNAAFHDDCSSELQSILAVFGVRLPRHSSAQMTVGRMVDLSAAPPIDRLARLTKDGVPMRTIIYVGGHVMLYLGRVKLDGRIQPMVYESVWGFHPADDSRRSVVGMSAILPIDVTVQEDPELISQAAKPIFKFAVVGSDLLSGAVEANDPN